MKSDAAVHKIAWGIKQYTTWVFPGNSVVKNLPAMQEMRVGFLGQEDPLEKEMATHSSILFFFFHSIILTWENPWTEEPDRL